MSISSKRTFLSFFLVFVISNCFATPTASLTTPMPDVTAVDAALNSFTITYSDVDSIDADSFATSNVTVSGPSGDLSVIGFSPSGNTVTYSFSLPGGAWAQADNGTYTVSIVAGGVKDELNNGISAQTIDTFVVTIDTTKPTATLTTEVPGITSAGPTPNTVTVTYADDFEVNTSTFGTNDISITGGSVGALTVTGISSAVNAVTYTFAPPGGAWAQADNDTYTVSIVAGGVEDTSGNSINSVGLQSFTVNIDTTKPSATLTTGVPDITSAGPTPNTVTVTYADGFEVNTSTFDTNDITITGGSVGALTVTGISSTVNAVTYTFAPPGGAWAQADNDTYTVSIVAGGVVDTSGNSITSAELQSFTVNIGPDNVPPVLTIPVNVSVTADGELTTVAFGTAVAVDAVDGALTPISDAPEFFTSGRHEVTWSVSDSAGNLATDVQFVDVYPLVEFKTTERRVGEGVEVLVELKISGDSPTYPVEIPVKLSGLTTELGHDAADNVLLINSAETATNNASFTFSTFDDGTYSAVDELIVFEIESSALTPEWIGVGDHSESIISVTDENILPTVEIQLMQNGQIVTEVYASEGTAEVLFFFEDLNGDTVSINYVLIDDIVVAPSASSVYSIDPSALTGDMVVEVSFYDARDQNNLQVKLQTFLVHELKIDDDSPVTNTRASNGCSYNPGAPNNDPLFILLLLISLGYLVRRRSIAKS
jgi:hypothetical protein